MLNANDDWFPKLDTAIGERAIHAFPNKKAAIEAATKFGWGSNVVRVGRRFERIWIVGRVDFQPEEVAGVTKDVLRVPMLRYETGQDGIERQPVVEFRKVRRKEGAK
jgi:hypothetical protein